MAAKASPAGGLLGKLAVVRTALVGLLSKFAVLRNALPELWIVFAIKIVGIVAYKLMNATWTLWLSYNLGFSDEAAGFLVGAWATLMTLTTVLVGSLTDAIGLRRAFLLGVWICVIARAVLTFVTVPWIAIGFGMIPLAIGEALGTPVMVAAVRRYSTTAQRSISFSLSYAFMNVGFWLGAEIFDYARHHIGEHGTFVLGLPGLVASLQVSTYQTLFLCSLLFELVLVPLIYFGIREGVEATDEGVVITPPQRKYAGTGTVSALLRLVGDTLDETARIFAGLWRQPGFYKFLAFLSLAAFVRLIFLQMDYLYPKFGIRELGEGSPIMRLYALNSILIIFLVPLVGALTQRVSAYTMACYGSAVAAASVFIMVLPTAWFAPLADGWLGDFVGHWYLRLGPDVPIHPYYVMIFFFMVLLSIGESIYSPRLYEYAAAIAPKGQEGSYMALSYLPFFVAKLCTAMLSGVLLAKFCPEVGPRDSATMWLIIALITAVAPIGLFALRRYIRVPEAGREPVTT